MSRTKRDGRKNPHPPPPPHHHYYHGDQDDAEDKEGLTLGWTGTPPAAH